MGPKLTSYKKQNLEFKNESGNKVFDNTIDIVCWRNDSKLTQEENEICIKYYQLCSKKLGMNILHYMREFH